MNDLWIGRFVRITNQYNDNFHERGQVADHHAGILTIRYATGKHAASSTQGVCMDPDQTTPVWPPPLTRMEDWAPKLGDFVNVERPDIGTTRGVIVGQTITVDKHWCDVQFHDAVAEVRRDLITLSTDQTTPIKVGGPAPE